MNYMKSTVNYLAILAKYPKLCTLLEFVLSVNINFAFKLNSTNYPLFQNCIELTDSSYTKLFSYYNKEKERLKQIYRQEVLRIDPINTKGRRAKEVVITKTKDIKNAECTSKKCPTQSEAGLSTTITTTTTTTTTTTITTTKPKKPRHVTTEEEKSILKPYFKSPKPSNKEIEKVLDSLLKLSPNY
ncbi:unnamed protein product [Rhizophagus irregularis]|nr:unnamed protein product [Rhizophagus irregularis]